MIAHNIYIHGKMGKKYFPDTHFCSEAIADCINAKADLNHHCVDMR